MKRILSLFSIIFDRSAEMDLAQEKTNRTILFWGAIFLCLISAALTVLNILKAYWFMTGTTALLTAGFAAACILAHRNHLRGSRLLMAVSCGLIFSVYALIGGNEGFAILWIVLVPLLSMMLVGLRMGFLLSVYFQLFLIVLFYTPLSAFVKDYYTSTFLIRYPILYFTSLALSTFLMCERQSLLAGIRSQACHDGLTGLYNRHYANELCKTIDVPGNFDKLTVIMIDINQLKATNDSLGHEAGDEMIVGAGSLIRTAFQEDLSFRTGGDEFMVISNRENIAESLEQFQTIVPQWKGTLVKSLGVSFGAASRMEYPGKSYEELLKLADEKMYESKRKFYSESGLDRRARCYQPAGIHHS